MSTFLTPHFTLEEMTTSEAAERLGLDNTPGEQELSHLIALCEQILEPARLAIGPLHISSGYRSPSVNKAVGGAPTSGHMLGHCADVIPINLDKIMFARWLRDNVKFDQIILEFGSEGHPAWIHVSNDPRYRGQVLRILKGTGYQPFQL